MWHQIPSLQNLKLFDSVVRCGSMTRAATEAGVSQSAVSQSIRQLEHFAGVELLDRSSRPMGLTEEGEALHRSSVEALARVAHVIATLRERGRENEGSVSVSCNLGFATYWLMPRLNFFSAAFPDIRVNVMAADQGTTGLHGDADIAIRFGRGQWPEGNWQSLLRESVAPMCTPEYLERVGPISDSRQLAAQCLIHVKVNDPDWLDWPQYFEEIGENPGDLQHGLRYNNYVQAVQTALTSDGIMLGWRSVVGDLLQSQQLTLALNRPVELDSGYFIKRTRQGDAGDRVDQLLGWLKEQACMTPELNAAS